MATYYAATNGTSANSGAEASPWDLATAFALPLDAADTVILEPGTFRGMYILSNAALYRPRAPYQSVVDINQTFVLASSIPSSGTGMTFETTGPVVTPPVGVPFFVSIDDEKLQVIKVDADTFQVYFRAQDGTSAAAHSIGAVVYGGNPVIRMEGAGSIIEELVVTNSAAVAEPRPTGIYQTGAGTKIRNSVVYDTGLGIYSSASAVGAEIYGNLLYNSGGGLPGNRYGVNLYIQNNGTPKVVSNNILFGAWGSEGVELQAYASESTVEKITFHRNVALIGRFIVGGAPSNEMTLTENMLYLADLRLGFGDGTNTNLIVNGNYVAGVENGVTVQYWQEAEFSDNKFYRREGNGGAHNVNVYHNGATPLSGLSFAGNEYATNAQNWITQTGGVLSYNTWAAWQALGFDAGGGFRAGGYAGADTFYLPNDYRAGRCHVVHYNWSENASFNLDLSQTGLADGQGYTIRNGLDYMGAAVASGTYNAASPLVEITLASLSIAQPVAASGVTNAEPSPNFSVFVVEPGEVDGDTNGDGVLTTVYEWGTGARTF
jgi:hypothetical protein